MKVFHNNTVGLCCCCKYSPILGFHTGVIVYASITLTSFFVNNFAYYIIYYIFFYFGYFIFCLFWLFCINSWHVIPIMSISGPGCKTTNVEKFKEEKLKALYMFCINVYSLPQMCISLTEVHEEVWSEHTGSWSLPRLQQKPRTRCFWSVHVSNNLWLSQWLI